MIITVAIRLILENRKDITQLYKSSLDVFFLPNQVIMSLSILNSTTNIHLF